MLVLRVATTPGSLSSLPGEVDNSQVVGARFDFDIAARVLRTRLQLVMEGDSSEPQERPLRRVSFKLS